MSKKRWSMVAVLAAMITVVGVLLLIVPGRPRPSVHAPSAPAPSSARLSQQTIDSYTVPPDVPKYISMPSINVPKTRIIQLGLTNNQIAVPDNINDAGWYNGSAKPGQSGAMFMYGHVSSWTANGIFYNLKKLQPGDKIYVTRGDDKQFVYQVTSLKVYAYDKVPMQTVLSPVSANTPGLNLMTCTGQVIKGTSEFNERLVVYTNLQTL